MSTTPLNPLLSKSELPFEAVPFQKIIPDHFLSALEVGVAKTQARVAEIANASDEPTFENTIVALEMASDTVSYVADVYFNLHSCEANDAIQSLAQKISSQLAELNSEISLNEKLFPRIKAIYEKRASFALNQEQSQLLEKMYKNFVRNGALLPADKKEQLKHIDQELARLGPQYSENLLKSTQTFELPLTQEADFAGLPESLRETLAEKAKARKKGSETKGVVTLDEPVFQPFLRSSDRRDLREKVWRAYMTRASQGEYNNKDIVKSIARLRYERARLLGYETHAHYVLEERMAQSPTKVLAFLDRLLKISRPAAEREMGELRAFAQKTDTRLDVMPWDFNYYYEKLRVSKFQLDPEKVREYFPFEKVLEGTFELAHRLYGIKILPEPNVDVYNADVKVFRVMQEEGARFIGLLYTDFFPRATKRGGAWCSSFRDQGLFEGNPQRPHVSIVGNFSPATESRPSLLTWAEVQTLFHEFGHALHALLSECQFRSLSGTNVYWDFVELPSQFMENWTLEDAVIDMISSHFQTGETLPPQWRSKLRDEAQFFAGYFSLRQLNFGYLDMAWHAADPTNVEDVEDFETRAVERTQVLPRVPGTNISCGFAHIFAGGYSAGYYSYKWAEVLDADAFEYFKKEGLFNPSVSERFRKCILSRGGTEHPMELYKKFRGREPDPDALLRRDGLLAEHAK